MFTNKPVGSKCPFGKYTYKKHGRDNICDGLCNNCQLNCTPDKFVKFHPVSVAYIDCRGCDADYETAILRNQDEDWID